MANMCTTRLAQPGRQHGFSLIELMIVVAIVAILASVAYPAYTDSVRKGRRAEARTALMELMQQQERYATQRNTYLAFSNSNGTTTPTDASTTFKVYAGTSSSSVSYWLSAATCAAPNNDVKSCITLTATPVRDDPEAGNLSINSIGEKSCTGTKPAVCWK